MGSVAKLLNDGLGTEATLAAVAETLRRGLPADRGELWLRDPGTTAFRPISAPMTPDAVTLVRSLDTLPRGRGAALRSRARGRPAGPARGRLDDDGRRIAILRVVADILAPYLAAAELSSDLAGEVAVQSREIDEHRRFTSLIVDSLPLGLYVVDRDYRIQSWNRKRETGTQGLRRDDVVGRPVFDVLTRQPAAQLRAEFDRVFATGEIQQTELEVVAGGVTRYFRLSKIPMRLDGDEISHVITIGEDVTEWQPMQAQITQSDKLAAVGQLAAGVMHEINNPLATIGACVAAIEGRPPAGRDRRAGGRVSARSSTGKSSAAAESWTACSTSAGPRRNPSGPVALNWLVAETLFLLKHHQRFKQPPGGARLRPRRAQDDG